MSKRMVTYKVGDDDKIASIDEYEVGGGTNVEANPQGEATQQLEKIKIDNIAYKIAGGGTDNYNDLTNKPKLGGFLNYVELSGQTNIDQIFPIGVGQNRTLLIIGGNSGNYLSITANGKFSGGGWPTPYPDNVSRAGMNLKLIPNNSTGGVAFGFTASDESWVCIYPKYLQAGGSGGRHFIEIPINSTTENENLKFVLDNKVPDCPTSEDGTYTLKCSVSGGVPTYSWVKDM